MLAYFYNSEVDKDEPQKPHQFNPNRPVTIEQLANIGVEYFLMDKSKDLISQVNDFASKKGYKNRDEVNISPVSFGDQYEKKLKIFFEEHIHEDEEIRLILEGTGYFDVRDSQDRWIRIALEAYDLIILPAGIYHRFTPDRKNFTKAMRLFKELPKWIAINRPADENQYRIEYLQSLTSP